jgi:cytochrome b561
MQGRDTKHSIATKLIHGGFAIAIVANLALSLIMVGPRRGNAGDFLFEIHEKIGITALVLAFAFWLVLMFRRTGTPFSSLFPWFSGNRIIAFWQDLKAHLMAVKKLKVPPYDENGAFASGIHGLGLLLMSAMAVSGGIYFVAEYLGTLDSPVVGLAMDAHHLLANLTWVYLIGHAGLALVHHYLDNMSIAEMWSLKPGKGQK